MRYRPEHKQEARANILAAAGRGFRRRGFGGIGIDGLAKEAKVTSGAFYGHFPSKESAFKEIAIAGLEELRLAIEDLRAERGEDWVEAFIDFYLSYKRVCDLGESCALQSLAPEVQRAGPDIKLAFGGEMERVVQAVADGLPGGDAESCLQRAWALLSILAGSVTLARSQESEAIGERIAAAARRTAIAICSET